MNFLYRLFCRIGLHQYVSVHGWIPLSETVSEYHDDALMCVWCSKIKEQTK